MRIEMTMRIRLLLIAALGMSTALIAGAQSGGPYSIPRSTIEGGGGESTGGIYTLNGIIGQSDASTESATGGPYSLTGGFYASANVSPTLDRIFADGFESP
jgi:hypothetical protein